MFNFFILKFGVVSLTVKFFVYTKMTNGSNPLPPLICFFLSMFCCFTVSNFLVILFLILSIFFIFFLCLILNFFFIFLVNSTYFGYSDPAMLLFSSLLEFHNDVMFFLCQIILLVLFILLYTFFYINRLNVFLSLNMYFVLYCFIIFVGFLFYFFFLSNFFINNLEIHFFFFEYNLLGFILFSGLIYFIIILIVFFNNFFFNADSTIEPIFFLSFESFILSFFYGFSIQNFGFFNGVSAKQIIVYQTKKPVVFELLLETLWTVFPSLILLIISVSSFTILYGLDDQTVMNEASYENFYLKVIGRQWYWSYEIESNSISAGVLSETSVWPEIYNLSSSMSDIKKTTTEIKNLETVLAYLLVETKQKDWMPFNVFFDFPVYNLLFKKDTIFGWNTDTLFPAVLTKYDDKYFERKFAEWLCRHSCLGPNCESECKKLIDELFKEEKLSTDLKIIDEHLFTSTLYQLKYCHELLERCSLVSNGITNELSISVHKQCTPVSRTTFDFFYTIPESIVFELIERKWKFLEIASNFIFYNSVIDSYQTLNVLVEELTALLTVQTLGIYFESENSVLTLLVQTESLLNESFVLLQNKIDYIESAGFFNLYNWGALDSCSQFAGINDVLYCFDKFSTVFELYVTLVSQSQIFAENLFNLKSNLVESSIRSNVFDSYMLSSDDYLIIIGNSISLLQFDTITRFRLLETDTIVEIPLYTLVRLFVTSTDVLHSWTVPSFGLKIDACPGRLNQGWLFLDREGVFYGQCSELCGLNHGFMPIVVSVTSL